MNKEFDLSTLVGQYFTFIDERVQLSSSTNLDVYFNSPEEVKDLGGGIEEGVVENLRTHHKISIFLRCLLTPVEGVKLFLL